MTDTREMTSTQWWQNQAQVKYRAGTDKGEANVRKSLGVVIKAYDEGTIDITEMIRLVRGVSMEPATGGKHR